jgi:hypothetical protein
MGATDSFREINLSCLSVIDHKPLDGRDSIKPIQRSSEGIEPQRLPVNGKSYRHEIIAARKLCKQSGRQRRRR